MDVSLSGEQTRARLAPTGDLSWPSFPPRPLPAEAHSDDFVVTVPFDAERWFAQASDDELVRLAREDWCNSYEADAIADFFRDAETKELFDYLDRQRGGRDAPGFECSVDQEAVSVWLAENRPHLAPWIAQECVFATPHYQVVPGEFVSDELGGSQGLEWEIRDASGRAIETLYESKGEGEEGAIARARELEAARS